MKSTILALLFSVLVSGCTVNCNYAPSGIINQITPINIDALNGNTLTVPEVLPKNSTSLQSTEQSTNLINLTLVK